MYQLLVRQNRRAIGSTCKVDTPLEFHLHDGLTSECLTTGKWEARHPIPTLSWEYSFDKQTLPPHASKTSPQTTARQNSIISSITKLRRLAASNPERHYYHVPVPATPAFTTTTTHKTTSSSSTSFPRHHQPSPASVVLPDLTSSTPRATNSYRPRQPTRLVATRSPSPCYRSPIHRRRCRPPPTTSTHPPPPSRYRNGQNVSCHPSPPVPQLPPWSSCGSSAPAPRQTPANYAAVRSQSKLTQEQLSELQKATLFERKELQQWYKGGFAIFLSRSLAGSFGAQLIRSAERLPEGLPVRLPQQGGVPEDLQAVLSLR